MAIYHCSIKIISRGKGKTAVGSAAYRAGEKIKNDYDGITHDFTKKGGVVHTEILLPDHVPREYLDRSVLWNAVERVEKAKNSQLAREFELALPMELSREQNINLVREYVKENFVDKGMCADVCIHDKGEGNPHAHIMLTMRPIEQDGTWGAKSKKEYILDDNDERIRIPGIGYKNRKISTVDWNEHTKAEEWRSDWADIVNRFLEQNNQTERIDHRSYERQGVDKIPSIHMGVAASQMEKKGIRTDRGDINRQVEVSNSQLKQLKARIRKAKEFWYAQPIENAPSSISIMGNIADSKNLNSRWQKIADLKTQASVFMFLQNNGITDMEQLVGKVTKINKDFLEVSDNIKKVDRRLETLIQHLTQYENYKTHKSVYDKYRQLDPKKQEIFYEKHSEEIELFKTAQEYLTAVMNGKTTIPQKSWQAEQKKLIAHRFSLCEKFYGLKDEIRNVELLRKGTENIMRDESHERQQTRNNGMEI